MSAHHPTSDLALLYEIKSSTGKGRGVFATQNLQPGTVILEDEKLMKIYAAPNQPVHHHEIHRAFANLTQDQKGQYLNLDPGKEQYVCNSKVSRIYRANTFREGEINFHAFQALPRRPLLRAERRSD